MSGTLLQPRPLPALDAPARSRVRRVLPWVLYAAFLVQLAVMMPLHEHWFDEAQAWLIVRDAGLLELFTERLRYEGSPGLWHLVLMLPVKLGLPYRVMGWIGAAFAAAGAAVLVRFGPFPLWVKAGLLFSSVIAYHYAAIARSYTLVPVLLFGVAALWPQRRERVGWLTLLLALLAHTSMHGTLIAGSIAAVYGVEVLGAWRELDRRGRRAHVLAAVVLLAAAALVVATLWPPSDIDAFVGGWSLDLPGVFVRMQDAFVGALTENGLVLGAAVALTVPWLARSRALALWLLPTLALLLLFAVKYFTPHHEGLLFLVWVFALWISLLRPAADETGTLLRRGALAGLALLLVIQVGWWFQSVRYDATHAYSGAPALAQYLRTLPEDSTVYTIGSPGFPAAGALPYLDRNPFANFNDGGGPGYVIWTSDWRSQLRDDLSDVERDQPDVFVWNLFYDRQAALPEVPGYRTTLRFPGERWAQGGPIGLEGFVLYERED